MSYPVPGGRRRLVATQVGAWTRSRRADDSLRRDRHKLTAMGALLTVIGWLMHAQATDRRAEREERATREATLTGALINLDRSIHDLKGTCR